MWNVKCTFCSIKMYLWFKFLGKWRNFSGLSCILVGWRPACRPCCWSLNRSESFVVTFRPNLMRSDVKSWTSSAAPRPGFCLTFLGRQPWWRRVQPKVKSRGRFSDQSRPGSEAQTGSGSHEAQNPSGSAAVKAAEEKPPNEQKQDQTMRDDMDV